MRIISGTFRGRRLLAPKGQKVRPTSDRVREALFNILGDRVKGARVLDLFAGTGALGLEALSRGAREAVFVDHHPASLDAIHRNLRNLNLEHPKVIRLDAGRGLHPLKRLGPFDLIFLDPPYRQGLCLTALAAMARAGLAAAQGLAVAEHEKNAPLDPGHLPWKILERRAYGVTAVTFLSWVEGEIPGPPDPGAGERASEENL